MKSKVFFSFSFILLALFSFMLNTGGYKSQNKDIKEIAQLTKLPRLSLSKSYLEEQRLSPQTNVLKKMDFVYAR